MSEVLKPGHCPHGNRPTVHPNYKRTPPVECHLNKNSSITQFFRDKFREIQLTWQRRSFVFHRVRNERNVPQTRLMRKFGGERIFLIRRIPPGLIWSDTGSLRGGVSPALQQCAALFSWEAEARWTQGLWVKTLAEHSFWTSLASATQLRPIKRLLMWIWSPAPFFFFGKNVLYSLCTN